MAIYNQIIDKKQKITTMNEVGDIMRNIIDYFEKTCANFPNKVAVSDDKETYTYNELKINAQKIASFFAEKFYNQPIAIYMDKKANNLSVMLGILYSGNFYIFIDPQMPLERIEKILQILQPSSIICDENHRENAEKLLENNAYLYNDLLMKNIDLHILQKVKNQLIDTNPAYVLFTSGSTGTPKGVVISHANVISYIHWFIQTFAIDENTRFGNQTPFYFSMSVTDIYATIFTGASLYIIPKTYFSFPIQLIHFLDEHKINTIYWVPSALVIVANLNLFHYQVPQTLQKVLFAGEVMPTKQFNYWRKYLDVFYANLFGPTETTDICSYYVIKKELKDDETIPIGKSCANLNCFLLDEENHLISSPNQIGELYVRGCFVGLGYYNNKEKTKEVFVQNPLQNAYPEMVYKTGDLVYYNQNSEMVYAGRKDFQIKHMGYRIELGEIETAANSIKQIEIAVAIYNNENIVLFYQGKLTEKDLQHHLEHKLPHYMMPNQYIKVSIMPLNANGKINRLILKESLEVKEG